MSTTYCMYTNININQESNININITKIHTPTKIKHHTEVSSTCPEILKIKILMLQNTILFAKLSGVIFSSQVVR